MTTLPLLVAVTVAVADPITVLLVTYSNDPILTSISWLLQVVLDGFA
ncbi:hypothetical protein [Flavobacterium psychrophilum]|nr:hypothetical protein [Flavobacterium psychrophilum]